MMINTMLGLIIGPIQLIKVLSLHNVTTPLMLVDAAALMPVTDGTGSVVHPVDLGTGDREKEDAQGSGSTAPLFLFHPSGAGSHNQILPTSIIQSSQFNSTTSTATSSELVDGEVIKEWTSGDKHGNYHYWALILVLVPLLTIFGNSMVIISVLRFRTLHSAINYMIMGLAIADLMVALTVMPFAVYTELNGGHWHLGDTLCDVYCTIDVTCSTASIMTLTVISFDRYRAVKKPIEYSKQARNTGRVGVILGGVWLISFATASPIVSGLNKTGLRDSSQKECRFFNADFIIWSSMVSFGIPLCMVLFVYARILLAIRARAKASRERKAQVHGQRQRRMSRLVEEKLQLHQQQQEAGGVGPRGSVTGQSSSGGGGGGGGDGVRQLSKLAQNNGGNGQFSRSQIGGSGGQGHPSSSAATASICRDNPNINKNQQPSSSDNASAVLRKSSKSSSSTLSERFLSSSSVFAAAAAAAAGKAKMINNFRKSSSVGTTSPPSAPAVAESTIINNTDDRSATSSFSPINDKNIGITSSTAGIGGVGRVFSPDAGGNNEYSLDLPPPTKITSLSSSSTSSTAVSNVQPSITTTYPLTNSLKRKLPSVQEETCGWSMSTNDPSISRDPGTSDVETFTPTCMDAISFIDDEDGYINVDIPYEEFRPPFAHERNQVEGTSLTVSCAKGTTGGAHHSNQHPNSSTTGSESFSNHIYTKNARSASVNAFLFDDVDCSSATAALSEFQQKWNETNLSLLAEEDVDSKSFEYRRGFLRIPDGASNHSFNMGSAAAAGGGEHYHHHHHHQNRDSSIHSFQSYMTESDLGITSSQSEDRGDEDSSEKEGFLGHANLPPGIHRLSGPKGRQSSAAAKNSLHTLFRSGKSALFQNGQLGTLKIGRPSRFKSSFRKKMAKKERKERKATKTLAVVVGVFLICWLPFFTLNIKNAICLKWNLNCKVQFLPFFLTTWLGYMNSFMNPIIYTIFNIDFRRAFRSFLCPWIRDQRALRTLITNARVLFGGAAQDNEESSEF